MAPPVIGVDEVGRGPLAGPVVSCACIYFNNFLSLNAFQLINDSKKLTHKQRKKATKLIFEMKREKKLNYALGYATVEEIDNLNILKATILSMKRAIIKLKINKGSIIVDGNTKLNIKNYVCKSIIKGDELSTTIATASIIAKVHRDRYMTIIAKDFPHFNWQKNSGYGTTKHIKQIKIRGITYHHRKSFNPIKKFIHNNNSSC